MPRRKRPENMPSPKTLERAADVVSERVKASRKVVNKMKGKWKTWEQMYKSEQLYQRQTGESNLVLPKADYIVETISAKVLNTVFSVSEWLTMKHYSLSPEELKLRQKWFMYVLDQKVNFYLTSIETFKGAPIKGTSIFKGYQRDRWPYTEYLELENFLPDPRSKKPGDIQDMRYCGQLLRRDLTQLKRFVNAYTGEPLYFNLDKVSELAKSLMGEQVEMQGTEAMVDDKITPSLPLVEYYGEFEHSTGSYADYVITGVLDNKQGDSVLEIIRCEPMKLKYKDPYTMKSKAIKPFVAAVYSINPGEFYGKSAIQPVESLINEQTDLHNIYMDNHKRMVNGITKVLNRSNLTRDDLAQVPGAIWWLDQMEDVEMEQPRDVNLLAYKAIHDLLDLEQEKSTGVTSHNLGVGKTKRETYGEVRSMLSESGDRYQMFIQMADRLTFRPAGRLIYELLRQSLRVFTDTEEQPTFPFDGQQIQISSDDLLEDMEVQFAATTVESEFSKYSKQQTFPQFLETLVTIAGDRINVDTIVKEVGDLFNFKEPQRFLFPSASIPIAMLPQDVQPYAQQILQQLQEQQGTGPSQPQQPQPQTQQPQQPQQLNPSPPPGV